MKHVGLFEGIGGFGIAAQEAGWETVAYCEIDSFCQMVLEDLFPSAEKLTDIKTTDFTNYANTIDIVTGGFPCQPYSVAGKREGDKSDKHLWPQMLRAIREIRPRWVVGENVPGLINWSNGMVFEQVQAELEDEGYKVQTYVLPACAVDAPHLRYRCWIVAYSDHKTDSSGFGSVQEADGKISERNNGSECSNASDRTFKNTDCKGRDGELREEESEKWRFGNIS